MTTETAPAGTPWLKRGGVTFRASADRRVDGRAVTGLPIHTIVRGRFVMRDRVLVEGARGWGRSVHPLQAMPDASPRHPEHTTAAILNPPAA